MKLVDETITHRGITIEFHTDDNPLNPWEHDEGMLPMLYCHDFCSVADYSGGYDIGNPLNAMSDRFITRNRHTIRKILGCNNITDSFDRWSRQEAKGWGTSAVTIRREYFESLLDDMRAGVKFDAISELWKLQGVPAYSTSSNGYSQGDHTKILFVAHPEWQKVSGIDTKKIDWGKEFESAENTFGAWAWGGVVGFIVDPDGERESCWGFYPEGSSDYFPLQQVHADCVLEAIVVADMLADKRDKEEAEKMELDRLDMYG